MAGRGAVLELLLRCTSKTPPNPSWIRLQQWQSTSGSKSVLEALLLDANGFKNSEHRVAAVHMILKNLLALVRNGSSTLLPPIASLPGTVLEQLNLFPLESAASLVHRNEAPREGKDLRYFLQAESSSCADLQAVLMQRQKKDRCMMRQERRAASGGYRKHQSWAGEVQGSTGSGMFPDPPPLDKSVQQLGVVMVKALVRISSWIQTELQRQHLGAGVLLDSDAGWMPVGL